MTVQQKSWKHCSGLGTLAHHNLLASQVYRVNVTQVNGVVSQVVIMDHELESE
jgi:hypothetical protein